MNYEQRLAHANTIYERGLERVATTPEPKGQKFPKGTRVRIGKLPPHMSHFPGEGGSATVLYTYAHAYGGDVKSYCLDVDGHGNVSWYEEEQLTELS